MNKTLCKTISVSCFTFCLLLLFALSGCSDNSSNADSNSGEITYDLMRMNYGSMTDIKFGTIRVEANDSESVYFTIYATHEDFQHNSYDIQLSDEDPNAGGTREFSFNNNERSKSTIGNFNEITAAGRYIDVMRGGASPGSSGVGRSKK